MGKNRGESREDAEFLAQLNRPNQVTDFGSVNWTVGDDGRQIMTTALSPELRAQFDALTAGAGTPFQMPAWQTPNFQQGADTSSANQFRMENLNFGPGAQIGVNNPFNLQTMLPGGFNENTFSGDRQRVEQAQFDRMMSLLNPQFERQEQALQQRLANQGLPQASRAYTAEAGQFGDNRNQATQRAALDAILAGGAEQSRMLGDLLNVSNTGIGQAMANRQQRVNEAQIGVGQSQTHRDNLMREAIAGHGFDTERAVAQRTLPFQERMSLFQLQQPGNFVAPSPATLPDYRTGGSSGPGALPGIVSGLGSTALAAASLFSDRRLKTDIKRVGQTDDGLPIYTFRFKAGGPVQMGVMAQDVAKVKPEAVGEADGWLTVDYGSL